jgi:NAD(P)-dependent dehydrogenase (short-subunit alcohol dehydrogenase family)
MSNNQFNASLDLPDLETWGLEGKEVLITGGSSGIGAATARLAAQDGAHVIVCDVASKEGEVLAKEINGTFVRLDVTSSSEWAAAVKEIKKLDLAILNAGVEFRDPAAFSRTADDPGEWNLEHYHRATNVNIDGVALGMHALVPLLDRLGGGAITVTASIAGLIPWTPDPIYSMTKWAVVGLVRASAGSLRRKNITINAVCPGGVATPMTRVFDGSVPSGMADPSHIARAHLGIAFSGNSGRVIKAVAGYAHSPHQFADVTNTF